MRSFRLLFGLLLGLAFPVLGLRAVELTSGPDVTATATNATLRWTTDSLAGARVQFGTNPRQLDQRVSGDPGTNHTLVLPRLKAGTTYHFTVGTARYPLATNSFATQDLGAGPVGKPAVVTNGVRPPISKAETAAPSSTVTWGSPRSLQDHFDRHGADFKARNPDDYAAQAWRFLQRARSDGLPAKRDEDGVIRVFDAKSGAFAAYNSDGTTKTYFKPGRRGYFADQPGDSLDLRQWKPNPSR